MLQELGPHDEGTDEAPIHSLIAKVFSPKKGMRVWGATLNGAAVLVGSAIAHSALF